MTFDGRRRGLSRRHFLGGLGVAAAASPFVPLLNASGLEPTFPKRLVLFFTPHGTIWDQWKPTGTETAFTLSPILAPLARHQSRLTVVSGLGIPDKGVGAPHTKGPSLLWTGSTLTDDGTFARADCSGGCTFGWNSGPSVDQVIVDALKPPTKYPSLQFGVRCGGNNPASRMIYTAAQQPLAPETDPWAAFGRLYGAPLAPSALARLQAERRSVLDVVTADLGTLRARAPMADRAKLDAHVTSIRALETRLQAGQPADCKTPALAAKLAAGDAANTDAVMNGHFDLMAAAFACDLTRVASYQHVIGDNDGTVYSWLGLTTAHHGMTHAPDSDTATWAGVQKIYTWFATKFGELLDRLAAIPEGSGSVLDNTLVVWGSELGKGNTHSFAQVPFVVAGGAGGAVRQGRFLQVAAGTTHQRLLIAMCQAMGATGISSIGNTDTGTGPLPGLLA
jgi:Protein of unknown function (DUF1552)